MALTRTASRIARIAARLPKGSPARRDLAAFLKMAGSGEDYYARFQFLSGLTDQPSNKIETAVKRDDKATYEKALLDIGFKPAEAARFLERGTDFGLYDTVRDSVKRSWKRDENYELVPGLKGISGEDVAQVLSVGGIQWPGMRWDGRKKEFVDRKRPAYPVGKNIYTETGKAIKGKSGGLRYLLNLLAKTAKNLTYNWMQSVDAGAAAKFVTTEEGLTVPDTSGYDAPPIESFLANKLYLAQIEDAMKRELASAPGQLRVFEAVIAAMKAGKDVLKYAEKGKGKGELTVKAKDLQKFMEEQYGDAVDPTTEEPYSVPTPQGIQKNFNKVLPKMVGAMEAQIEKGLKGLPREQQQVFRDRDIAEVYRQDVRGPRRASRNITAKDRVALVRLAASLPKGDETRRAILASLKRTSVSKVAADFTWSRRLNEAKAAFMREVVNEALAIINGEGGRAKGDVRGVIGVVKGVMEPHDTPVEVRFQWDDGFSTIKSEITLGREKRTHKNNVLSLAPMNVASEAIFKHFGGLLT